MPTLAKNSTSSASVTLNIKLPTKESFDVIRLGEPIQLDQHIRKFKVEAKINGQFVPWIEDSSVGARVILTEKEIYTDELSIIIEEYAQKPTLSEASLWKAPVILNTPQIKIDKANTISLQGSSGTTLRYTLDGSEPTESSLEYTAPITLPQGGVLKAASL